MILHTPDRRYAPAAESDSFQFRIGSKSDTLFPYNKGTTHPVFMDWVKNTTNDKTDWQFVCC